MILFAQSNKLERGLKLYDDERYADAIPVLKKALKEDAESYFTIKLLANAYRKIKDYENAELFFILVVNSDSVQAEDHLYYGQSLKANGKLAAAKDQFLKFAELSQNEFLGNMMLQSIDEIEAWEKEPKGYSTKSEGALNSSLSEYGLVFFKNVIYITSNRERNENSPEASSFDGSPFYGIYEANQSILNEENERFKLATGLINSDYHDGPLSINEQEDRLVITRIDNQARGKDFVNRMKLYEAEYIDGKWKNFRPLPFNSDDYSVCHAHLADSGRTLYFASDMPGGIGGFDLYSVSLENGKWTAPKNLGSAINTSRNELFPLVHQNKLYFSSDGFPGYGGLDIMVAEYNDQWQAPDNLKSPINSNRDDFSIYFIDDSSGYYASNREGGLGKDDLYKFQIEIPKKLVDIHGIYEYQGLPAENVKVMLLDKSDSTISIEYTDENGRFQFLQLPYNQDFFVRIDEEDEDLVKKGRLFLTDESGVKLRLLERIRWGYFTFKTLPADEFVRLDSIAENDPELLDKFKFYGKLFRKLPGDYQGKTMVYLYNDEGLLIDSTLTDQFGYFHFEKLAKMDDYLIALKEEDPSINIALETALGRIFEVITPDGKGIYTLSPNLDASLRRLEARNNGVTAMIAKIEHRGLPLKMIKVNIYDADGTWIGTTYTNEKGVFQFNKLDFDDVYFVEFPELDEEVLYASILTLLNLEGDPLYLIKQLENGRFKFHSLPFDEYEFVKEDLEAYIPNIIRIAGQVYKKLPGDFKGGIQVYVYNEDGELIDSTFTDQFGKFQFEKLSAEENYTFRLAGEKDELNLAFLDDKDRILELATITKNGSFTYKKLTYQIAQFEPLEEVDVQLIEDEFSHEIMGQVFQKLPGDFQAGMKVFVYDENGFLLGITETDSEGKFHFKKLAKDKNYFFKIEDEDDHFQLVTLDEFDQIIDKTVKNKHGQFTYSSLSLDENKLLIAEERDHAILDLNFVRTDLEGVAIHYRFDSVEVRPVDRAILNKLIEDYKSSKQVLEVHSYTDNRGSAEYNIKLSKKRTDNVIRYLVRNGFPRERIIGNYSGMLNPVVDCDQQECDNDDHYLNRRTEFKLLNTID